MRGSRFNVNQRPRSRRRHCAGAGRRHNHIDIAAIDNVGSSTFTRGTTVRKVCGDAAGIEYNGNCAKYRDTVTRRQCEKMTSLCPIQPARRRGGALISIRTNLFSDGKAEPRRRVYREFTHQTPERDPPPAPGTRKGAAPKSELERSKQRAQRKSRAPRVT